MDLTPPEREVMDVESLMPDLLPPEDGVGVRLKNRQSSSWVASEGTFPAHITHSERFAGGLGWYALRADCWSVRPTDGEDGDCS